MCYDVFYVDTALSGNISCGNAPVAAYDSRMVPKYRDKKLLELIRLHLQAYVNTGNSLNPEMEEIRTALETLGQGQRHFDRISVWWQKDSADKERRCAASMMASDKGKPDEHS